MAISFYKTVFFGLLLHGFAPCAGLDLPKRLSPHQAFEFIEHSLDQLTGEQIADCIRVLEANNDLYHKAWEIVEANVEATKRHQEYLEASSSEEEGGLGITLDYEAFRTIPGCVSQLSLLGPFLTSNFEQYIAIVSRLPSRYYYMIEAFFIMRSYWTLSVQDLVQQAFSDSADDRDDKLKRFVVLMHHLVTCMRDPAQDSYVASVLRMYNECEILYITVLGAFIATIDDAALDRWKPFFGIEGT